MTYTEDARIWPTLVQLSVCLTQTITDAGLPVPAFLGILPGSMIAADYCGDEECGQAWVRLATVYPSQNFPNPDDSAVEPQSYLAYSIEVGILRCAPMPADDGTPPSVAEQLESARLQMADMSAIRRAIQCCLDQLERPYLLGSYDPIGPEGGCVGGSWSFTLGEN